MNILQNVSAERKIWSSSVLHPVRNRTPELPGPTIAPLKALAGAPASPTYFRACSSQAASPRDGGFQAVGRGEEAGN